MLIVVLLACTIPRTLAMRGFVAGAFRTAERTLREKGLLPGPDDDGSRTRRESPSDEDASAAEGDAAADAAGASEVIVEADEPGDDAEVDPMHDTTLPPAERLFRVATRTTEERPHSQRAARRAAALLREALELDPNHAPALTALGRAHQAGEGVDADDATALDLFRRAANLGDAGKFFFFRMGN
jgi:TPR repeat protein